MPFQFRAMIEMAQAQQGAGGSVNPLPLVKLLAPQSHCSIIVDRGAGFDALQRERALAAGASGAAQPNTLQAVEYMLVAQVVYSDAKSRRSDGAADAQIAIPPK